MAISSVATKKNSISQDGLATVLSPQRRAERTPGEVAVSAITRECRGEVKTLPGIPQTNLSQALTADLTPTKSTPSESIGETVGNCYLDCKATSPSTLSLTGVQENRTICGSLCKVGEDEEGNGIVVRLACRREWCPTCRLIDHKRRISSALPRLLQLDWMAYLVVTFPLEVRVIMNDPKLLTILAKKLRQLLRKQGYRKVYTRWHFFGEHGEKYHPHLNVLCDGGWLSPEELARLKDLIRRKLLKRSIARRIKKDLVIHYDFTQDAKRKMHWVKYVTKASFTDRGWDEQLASRLKGFHNGCFAGTWNDPPKWRLTGTDKKFNTLLKVKQGIHPISGKPIVWDKPLVPWALVQTEKLIHLGAWCYCYTATRAPPLPPLDISNLTELDDDDYRKHPNDIRREIDRHRELLSRRQDCEFDS